MSNSSKAKRVIFVIIIFAVLLIGSLGIKEYLSSKNEKLLIEENIKKQKEIKELINIDSISQEFMDNYFNEVNQIKSENKENILIVISKENITETYGAINVISAPNNQYFLEYDSETEKTTALEKLKNNSDIVSVEENPIFYIETSDENVTYNSWGIEKLGYDDAINTINSIKNSDPERIKDVVVAVIDTGLNVGVFNQKYTGKLLEAYDVIDPEAEMTDSSGHGTHTAGTVAESTPANVKIIAVKASDADRSQTGDESSFYGTDLINAINYIVDNKKADVISFSIGGYSYSEDFSASYYQTIEGAKRENIILVASAGNKNTDQYHYPSSYDNTISVAAIDSHFEKAVSSNYGESITFAAPGYKIKSIISTTEAIARSGTSMAVPHVSSAVAILKSFNKDLTLDETISLLKKYAIDIGDDGWDEKYGYGVVNFEEAVFCSSDVVCDEYNVFQKDEINTLSTIKIESLGTYIPEYNYGSITNFLNTEINLYYTDDDYYTKTLSQLIENIEIIGYDPYSYEQQSVTIKYKELETILNVDNSQMQEGWKYEILEDNTIKLTELYCTVNSSDAESYIITDFPQVIYIPSEINGQKVSALGDEIFKDKAFKHKNNLKRVYISSGIKNIGNSAFTISSELETELKIEQDRLEIIFPDSVESIDETAFENRDNILFYVYKDSVAYNYALANSIDHLYIDTVDVNLQKNEYKSFEKIDTEDLSITVTYKGSLESISETINNYTIKYNNENDSFRYGDESFIVEFDTDVGYHINQEVTVSVIKATHEYEVPNNLSVKIGQKLSEIELPENFEWMNPDQEITEVGDLIFEVKYVPSDTINYEIVENIEVTVSVSEEKNIITPLITISDKTYDSTTGIDISAITIQNLNSDDVTIENAVLLTSEVGDTTANVTLKLSDEKFLNYQFPNGLQEQVFTVVVKIIPQEMTKPTLVDKIYTFNNDEQTIQLNNYDDNKMNISGNKRTNAGEQDVVISLKNSNYIWEDKTSSDIVLKFKIEKANLEVSDTSQDVTVEYDGQLHSIDVNLEYNADTILKYMDENNEYTLDEVPKYSEVGTYVIKYKLYINDNYNEYLGEKILNIISNEMINNSSDYEGIYDGNEHSINISIQPSNYNIKYSINNTNYDLNELPKFKEVGEYTINYKITTIGYGDMIGSNKVKIYGIKEFDSTLELKDTILVVKDYNNSFKNISEKIKVYSPTHIFNHYDKDDSIINDDLIKTGEKINININNQKDYKYTISILGDVSGDGKINYLDYVSVYNHIYKNKHPESEKKILSNEHLLAADTFSDEQINYLDYVKIYNKIKELKGGAN